MDKIVFYYPKGHEAHYERGHPERPERVEVIRDALIAAGWWDRFPFVEPIPIPEGVLTAIHSKEYLESLKKSCRHGEHLDMDTYTTTTSWELAMNSVGGAAALARGVWRGEAQVGFALTRPPGHHATRKRGMGFCLLNNAALAAEYLLSAEGAHRLAIIDLDLHHGNGTQNIFWEREDVFYFSTHQSPLYPGSGHLEETGAGEGAGKTANFPLPPGSGDQAFIEFTDKIIVALMDQYLPQMILISFGFDPHWRDPLGHLQLSAAGYGNVVNRLQEWADKNCQGKIALFLEGGYDLEAGAACSQAVVAALLHTSWYDNLGPAPDPEGNSWRQVFQRAKEIWGL